MLVPTPVKSSKPNPSMVTTSARSLPVESVRSGWHGGKEERRNTSEEAYPITVELLQLLGHCLKKAGYRDCRCMFECGEESAYSVGVPWSDVLIWN